MVRKTDACTVEHMFQRRCTAPALPLYRIVQVIAEADFAHHVGSNTLRLELSCSLAASVLAA